MRPLDLELTAALGFCKRKQYSEATQVLTRVFPSQFVDTFVSELPGPFPRSKESKEFYTPFVGSILAEVFPDALDCKYLIKRLELFPIEEVYSHLDWNNNPHDSLALACSDYAGKLCQLRRFDLARDIIGNLRAPEQLLELISAVEQNKDLDSFDFAPGLILRSHLEPSTRYQFDEILRKSLPLFEETAAILSSSKQPRLDEGDLLSSREFEIVFDHRSSGQIDVSIVIPTYNRPELIIDAARSFSNQPSIEGEIIVVNDAGKELPPEIESELKSLGACYIRHLKNYGLGASRNTGATQAKGTWLMVLDDDDVLLPGGVYELFVAGRQTDADFVYGDHIRQYFENDKPTERKYHKITSDKHDLLWEENLVSCGTFLIKRAVFEQHRGYRQDLAVHEDYNLHLRVAKDHKLHHIDTPIFQYNIRTNIERMNTHRRLFWYATSCLNHLLFRRFHGESEELKRNQKHNNYQHVARALKEGANPEWAKELIFEYWKILLKHGLQEELYYEFPSIEQHCPQLAPLLNTFKREEI